MLIEQNKNTIIKKKVALGNNISKYTFVSLNENDEVIEYTAESLTFGISLESKNEGEDCYICVHGITKINKNGNFIIGDDVYCGLDNTLKPTLAFNIANIPPNMLTQIKIGKAISENEIFLENNNIALAGDYIYSTNTTINTNSERKIMGNLTISGANTIITIRSNSPTDHGILEIQGDLNIRLNCELVIIKCVLKVNGNITGNGTITTLNGANGGPGGIGGDSNNGSIVNQINGTSGSIGSLLHPDYNIFGGNGLPGGGGGGSWFLNFDGNPDLPPTGPTSGGAGFGGGGGGSWDNATAPGGTGIAPSGPGGNGVTSGPGMPGGLLGGGGGTGNFPRGIGGFGTGLFVPTATPDSFLQWVGLAPNPPAISLAPFKGGDGNAQSVGGHGGGGGAGGGTNILDQNGRCSGAGGFGGTGSSGCNLTIICLKNIFPTIKIKSGFGGYSGIPGISGISGSSFTNNSGATHNRLPTSPSGNIYLFYNLSTLGLQINLIGAPAITTGPTHHQVTQGPPGNLEQYSIGSPTYNTMLDQIGFNSKQIGIILI